MRFALLFSLLACAVVAQVFEPLSFSVASVKPTKRGDDHFMLRPIPGGGLSATGVTVKMLLMNFYGLQAYQITGEPTWVDTERWDIEAKADDGPGANASLEEVRTQLSARGKSLLGDRFQFKARLETPDLPVYSLLVAKGGPKLKPHPEDNPNARAQIRFRGAGSLTFGNISMANFVVTLAPYLGRKMIDRTDLKGKYDFELKWTLASGEGRPESFGLSPQTGTQPPPTDSDSPSIFTALQEQLGLRLESTKGPVDLLIVEHVERPSDN